MLWLGIDSMTIAALEARSWLKLLVREFRFPRKRRKQLSLSTRC